MQQRVKLYLLFFFLPLIWKSSVINAQKYGIDVGWFYSKNNFRAISSAIGQSNEIISLKAYNLPNVSIRPYIKIKNKFYLYFGLDLLRYKFNFNNRDDSNSPITSMHQISYREFHIPVMFKYMWNKDNFTTSAYAGAFYRGTYQLKENIDVVYPDNSVITTYHNHAIEGGIIDNHNGYLNFIAGIKENIRIKNWFKPYVAIDVKYFSGYFHENNMNPAYSSYLSVKNNFSINFTIGISLQQSGKQHSASGNGAMKMDD